MGLLVVATSFSYTTAASSGISQEVLSIGDPCAGIGRKKWVFPGEVRRCFKSFPVDPKLKANAIVNKTLAFHTSVNYQVKAPEPFSSDVHEDLIGDLARISKQSYASDFDLHVDLSRTLKRLNDGHCVYINYCYDCLTNDLSTLFISYLPTPLVLLNDGDGAQNVHIAPEAFTVAAEEFPDQIDYWEGVLPEHLTLSALSGVKVLLIDGTDPFETVNANAAITGGYTGYGTRQNSFFSSYQLTDDGWNYVMGNFAQQSLPLYDSVNLTIIPVNSSEVLTINLPYRARFGSTSVNFTDSASLWENNCLATNGTNGVDLHSSPEAALSDMFTVAGKFEQQPRISVGDARKHRTNVYMDVQPQTDVDLPEVLKPGKKPLNGSQGVAQFYMLDDGITGVLALGSFSAPSFDELQTSLIVGLTGLKSLGATQLVVDVTNNGGGFICIAHWLHRIISGPRSSTVPQAGLDTTTRAGPLARLIVKQVISGADVNASSSYNSAQWTFANHSRMPEAYDWMASPEKTLINGREDAFSQRLGQECQPFDMRPPAEALFDPKKVAIVSNGRCGSSCSLFSITMAKEDGAKTVVVGGNKKVPQQYCGTVGGQSTRFPYIDTEIKTAGLKNHSLAPPDFITNSVQGITWRLGFGIWNANEPEEWQSHPADYNLLLTNVTVNNPVAIWEAVVTEVL
ncbi:hypothetical protein NEOLEDRAFT_1064684 [Neolentinus lepideus HHB14362 ss-1]|uniref:Tail specific protease domain-containing protein n=1 Tax=Neolentinus lepideus HHB14362 ss-1 TaxID=1314782 RepID=A0A165SSX3_9AGAM|nr:hypothetical protein NEOLEDRAFT_1064684 [Neolentinus lepideus HHB14362 ss-1]